MSIKINWVFRWILVILLIAFLLVGALILFLFIRFRSGAGINLPTTLTDSPAPTTIPLETFTTQNEINLPIGFSIGIFAEGLNGPRMMAIGPDGNLYATERGAGRVIRLPDKNSDGRADVVEIAIDGLESPSGLAFYQDGSLYVAEPGRVLRFLDVNSDGEYDDSQIIIDAIPASGHNTRTLLFSPDWQSLFVSIGSSCNVCDEEDKRRAAITRYNPDGTGEQIFAVGLRNAVGMVFRPGTDEIWATNNGRDWLGDDLPPETVNIVQQGDDFGWPRCHSGRISDPDFGGEAACDNVKPPAVEMQAHSAPLGLNFYTGNQFPEEYVGDLFIAFHGSWNRNTPTGYKVVRIPVANGLPGSVEDFAWGWLTDTNEQLGRPVDVISSPDGTLYVTDDSTGVIYRITYAGDE